MRFTKTATGRNRTTFTLPGTGISHVSESGGKKKNRKVSESTAPARKRKRVNSAGLLNICAVVSSVISVAIGSNFGLTAGIIVFLVLVIISAIICSIKGK
jgi:K+-sensing histidine kinase KdpD